MAGVDKNIISGESGGEKMEELFADMAKLYAEDEGDRLHDENNVIGGEAPFALSAGFDDKVYRKIRMEKYRRPVYISGALAACFLLMLIGVNIFSSISGYLRYTVGGVMLVTDNSEVAEEDADIGGVGFSGAAGGASGAGGVGGTGGVPFAGAAGGTGGAPFAGAAGGTGGAPFTSPAGGAPGHEMIALSFNLPPNLSITNVTQDIGQTVFHINEANSDDIVLIAEKSGAAGGTGVYDEDRLKSRGLKEIAINDTKVFAVAKADYSYLTFQSEGIIYSMACKYDYNTIIALCEYIL
ncbi:MAG: hypothetical protein FWH01_08525 [Oscillospiraceae bacterium]|nr:hypothetical protein [Oscillospiraceae bacterium]